MKVYELVLESEYHGYRIACPDKDRNVRWVRAPSLDAVKRLIAKLGLKLFRDVRQLAEGKYAEDGIDCRLDALGSIVEGTIA